MKISKILAGVAALAMTATTVMSVSAADSKVWIQDWKVAEQKKVIAFDNMDTATAWNGCWVQFYSTDKSLSDVTVTFTIDTTNAVWQDAKDEAGNVTGKMNETGTYTIMRANDTSDETTAHGAQFEEGVSVGALECTNDNGVYTVTVPGSFIASDFEAGVGGAQINGERNTKSRRGKT